ncbi:jg15958 [Pararge aegeria aegeria]|uniref:Jg15958 protein n=1 Tax=Pararge aegeria aegeria TaxID=348720 RepID=A0A8S4QD28_9NEOP|nr:jg15958 [Pararge aegeria aegeria]
MTCYYGEEKHRVETCMRERFLNVVRSHVKSTITHKANNVLETMPKPLLLEGDPRAELGRQWVDMMMISQSGLSL